MIVILEEMLDEIRKAWEHHEGIVLEQEDGKLTLVSENKAGKEAKQ